MRTLNQGNLLTWYKSDATYNGLRNGGRQDKAGSCLFALPGESISIYLNWDTTGTPTSIVAVTDSDSVAVGSLTAHTSIGGQRHLYGTLTLPSNPGLYRLSFAGAPVYVSTPIWITPNAQFLELNTHLYSFRNDYTIDGIEYPHISSSFRQNLRMASDRFAVDTQSIRQENRRPDGVLRVNNASKYVRYKMRFPNVDDLMSMGLLNLSMHTDVKINGLIQTPVSYTPAERSISQTSSGVIVFEDQSLAHSQICKFL